MCVKLTMSYSDSFSASNSMELEMEHGVYMRKMGEEGGGAVGILVWN